MFFFIYIVFREGFLLKKEREHLDLDLEKG